MTAPGSKKQLWTSLAVVLAFAAFGGWSLWYWGPPTSEFLEEQERIRAEAEATAEAATLAANSESARIAERYVFALQNEDCATAIELTGWMQDRLAAVQGQGTEAEGEVLRELCESISERVLDGQHLYAEGIEDQYLMAPMAQVSMVDVDEGRTDLEKPVQERVWFHVSYPVPTQALRDANGTPIKSVRAGLNVSKDGQVLKGELLGNFEIDFDSISYAW